MNVIPLARTENLLIQEIGNELIVYDRENNSSHCLNSMAARIWELCDGQHTIKDIAKELEKELDISADEEVDMRGLVWLTLEELEKYRLIQEYIKQPTSISSISRRTVIKTSTLVGGFAIGSMFPLVRSIIAPTPVMAVSPSFTCGFKTKTIAGKKVTICEGTCPEGEVCGILIIQDANQQVRQCTCKKGLFE